MAGTINPSKCKKDTIKSYLKLPRCLHPVRRIFISISLSPRYRRMRDVWRKVNGYHFGVMCCAWASAMVLVVNLTVTIWSVKKFGIVDGLGTFQTGDCGSTSRSGFWLHLIINGLSTLLLGASNYSMQCLSAPTRSEIDRAHQKCIWLDVGTPSVRNLRRISWSRIGLWWSLAISSIPLHLFWNSAVVSTLYSREYYTLVVPVGFPAGGPFYDLSGDTSDDTYQQLASKASVLQRLEPRACLEAYVGSINSNRGDVALVSSYNTTDGHDSLDAFETVFGPVMPGFPQDGIDGPSQWICGIDYKDYESSESPQLCDLQRAASNVSSWVFEEWNVQYCLSEQIQEQCKLQFSAILMIVVIGCNFIKMSCMAWIAWKQDSEPLVTLGDAIASFITTPDKFTAGNCIAGKESYSTKRAPRLLLIRDSQGSLGPWDEWTWETSDKFWGPLPLLWSRRRKLWFTAASKKRWVLCNGLFVVILSVVSFLLHLGLMNNMLSSRSISYLWSLGFGTVTAESIIVSNDWPGQQGNEPAQEALLLNVLISNTPQLILSFLYLTYNGLFTSMLLAREWSGFAHHRKTLRITSPHGQQRSTYWLQLPYRYSIPLLAASSLLHWLVSQSIFLARVTVLDPTGVEDSTESISTCGYSNIAIIFVIGFGSILPLIAIAHGFRKYPSGMPFAANCSAAISGTCHPPEGDIDAAYKPLQWGVTGEVVETNAGERIGHCSFTSLEVTAPVEGQLYA